MPAPVTIARQSNVQKLRDLEAKDLSDGGLDAKEIAELKSTAKTPEEKALVEQMIQHDAFTGGAKTAVPNRSPVVGQSVGNTKVVRDYSPPQGYDDRNQAIGAANLAGGANLAVVQDPSGKWHAVQTKDPLSSQSASAMPITPGSAADIKAAQQKYEGLAKNDTQGQNEETMAAAKHLAALTFGVPESAIKIVHGPAGSELTPGVINVNVNQRNAGGADGKTDPAAVRDGHVASSITIGAVSHGGGYAATTLFHEGVHASDHDQAIALRQKFDALTPKPTFKGQPMSFELWLSTQSTKDPSNAAVYEKAKGDKSPVSNETHAHLQSFMASFRKDPKTAIGELTELNGDFTGADGATVQQNAKALRAYFNTLTPAEQTAFKGAFAALPDGGMAKAVFKAAFPGGIS